jgi:tetratricopeptide (TPR) repeat protein
LEDKSKATDAVNGLRQEQGQAGQWHSGGGSSSTSSSGGSSSTSSSSGDVDLGGGGDLVLEGGRFDSNANGVRERQLTTAATGSPSGGGGGMDGEFADDRTARANNPHPTAQPAPVAPVEMPGRAGAARGDAPVSEARRVAVAGGLYKGKAPAWVEQLNQIPTKDQIAALHAQVSANPRDRGLRNAYAQALLVSMKWDELQGQAFEWMPFDPENPQVYEYLGKSATGLKDFELALRAMTSIAEIAPNRAALLARAGWLLLTAEKFEMAQQMFREALKNRQDDCNIYRGLALALWLDGKHEDSAKILSDAIGKDFDRRYGDTRRVLKEELGYVLRAWAAAGSVEAAEKIAQKADVMHQLKHFDALRVTMCWETDANDVDLHVADPSGEECWYSHKQNASGLELYSDQTQGLGPEVIRTERALDGTYSIAVNYFAAGPMGVSRGVVVTMEPNAEGVVTKPMIVPFCLIPGGPDMRLIGTANFTKQ